MPGQRASDTLGPRPVLSHRSYHQIDMICLNIPADIFHLWRVNKNFSCVVTFLRYEQSKAFYGQNERIKRARWWFRLGGRPVDHTASPKSIKAVKNSVIFKQQTKKLTLSENPVKRKTQELKKPSRGLFSPHIILLELVYTLW